MGVTMELLTAPEIYLLRQGPKHLKYGDPWVLSGVVEKFGSFAVAKGVFNISPDPGHLLDIRSIRQEFHRIGIIEAQWDRSKEGVFIPHSIRV